MPRNLLVVGHATRARRGLAGFELGCIYVGLLMGRSILPACSRSSLALLLLEPFPSDVRSRMLTPLLMYCGEPAIFCSSRAESIIRGCTTESACHSPHALILPSPPYVCIFTVSNIHQHSSGLCDVGAMLVTTLYSHDMLLHVLKPRGALGKPISPSFAETYLALGTPTEVASNYGQAYSQEQNND